MLTKETKHHDDAYEVRHGQETNCQFFIARCDAPEVLDLAKPIFDFVPFLVFFLGIFESFGSVFLWRNDALYVTFCQQASYVICIVGSICRYAFDLSSGLGLFQDSIEPIDIVTFAC